MLLPLKAICDPKKARRDGTSLIYIQYCYTSENRTLLNTEIAIPAKHWNKRKLCISPDLPTTYGDYEHLNNELTRQHRLIEDLITQAQCAGIENILGFVKDTFTPSLEPTEQPIELPKPQSTYISKKKQPELFAQIDDYIKSKERKVCEKALATYKSMKDHLFAYQTFKKVNLSFNSFDYNFYEDFIEFLSFDYLQPRRKQPIYGLKTNTVGKTIKQLRIFIGDRVRRKIIHPIDLSDFKIPDEETDAIYLTYAEIAKLYNTDLSDYPSLIEYRDFFVLACLTGLRFSDFSSLRPEDLRNDMLHKKQGKSDHWVIIPLRHEAKAIFTAQFKERIPHLTNPEFNRHIKTVGKIAGLTKLITFGRKKGNEDIIETRPKYDWITTHTARRSFCTNEFLAGTPVKLIMQISGHKNEKDFYKYIRISPMEAANKIKKLWEERNGLAAFNRSKSA